MIYIQVQSWLYVVTYNNELKYLQRGRSNTCNAGKRLLMGRHQNNFRMSLIPAQTEHGKGNK